MKLLNNECKSFFLGLLPYILNSSDSTFIKLSIVCICVKVENKHECMGKRKIRQNFKVLILVA